MNDEPATEKQIRAVWGLEKALNRVPVWRDDMTKEFASRLISDLKEQLEIYNADNR